MASMSLNSLAAPKSASDFQKAAVGKKRNLQAPRPQVRSGSDPFSQAIKLLMFGAPGSGKSVCQASLLALGQKVFSVVTDIGGSGSLSTRLWCRNVLKKPELLENFRELELNSRNQVEEFLDNPASFWPEIYDWNPDVITWDTFSGFQQIDVMEHVEGLGLTTEQFWGEVRKATINPLDKFLNLNNNVNGKIWHKIVMCHENEKSKSKRDGASETILTREPLIQGSAGKIAMGAFDLIIRTYVTSKVEDEDSVDVNKRAYRYTIEPASNVVAKNRGFDLPPNMPAKFDQVWTKLMEQIGVESKVVASEGE
jgi:hypothetical protein